VRDDNRDFCLVAEELQGIANMSMSITEMKAEDSELPES
jgi:hypothetical protein